MNPIMSKTTDLFVTKWLASFIAILFRVKVETVDLIRLERNIIIVIPTVR
jgi:hypothetical protein